MENLLGNYYYLMSESMRNIARVKAYSLLKGTDVLKENAMPTGKRTMTVRVDGKPKYFTVSDPDIYYALVGVHNDWFHKSVKKWITLPKRFITRGVTFRPAFRIANFLRDTMQTMVLHGDAKRVFRTCKAAVDAYKNHPDFVEFASQGGAFSGTFDNPSDASKVIKEATSSRNWWNVPGNILKVWDDLGTAAENANRLALYRERVEQGNSKAEAALVAKDLMDFSMHGQSGLARGLITLVPFLNARIQGLYKLGRGYTEDRAGFLKRAAVVAGLSAANAILNATLFGDGWDELEDYDRWNYWHFGPGTKWGFRIPMPFEVGALFGALPTLAAEYLRKDAGEATKDLGKWAASFLTQTMMFNPVQVGMPIIETWADKNFFTGRPIEGKQFEGAKASERYNPWTSNTMKLLGEVTGFSPLKMDHLLTQYFGGYHEMGKLVMDHTLVPLVEAMGHSAFPEDPALTRRDYWFVGRFMGGGEIPRNTRYDTEFYELMQEYDEVYSTYLLKQKRMDKREAKRYGKDHREELKLQKRGQKVRTKLTKIRTRMRMVWYNNKLSDDQKRVELDKLQAKRNKIMKEAVEEIK